jgi:hypothetical protein
MIHSKARVREMDKVTEMEVAVEVAMGKGKVMVETVEAGEVGEVAELPGTAHLLRHKVCGASSLVGFSRSNQPPWSGYLKAWSRAKM